MSLLALHFISITYCASTVIVVVLDNDDDDYDNDDDDDDGDCGCGCKWLRGMVMRMI